MADLKNPERLRPRRSMSSTRKSVSGKLRQSTPMVTEDDIQALLNWRPSFETAATSSDASQHTRQHPSVSSDHVLPPTNGPRYSAAAIARRSRGTSLSSSVATSRRGSVEEDSLEEKWSDNGPTKKSDHVFVTREARIESQVEANFEDDPRNNGSVGLMVDPASPSQTDFDGNIPLTTSTITSRKSKYVSAAPPNLLVREVLDQDLTDLLLSERITAITASSRLLVVGTLMGMIHIFSVSGHKIKSVSIHYRQITDLCLLDNDAFLASCSMDGHVVILDPWQSADSDASYQKFNSRLIGKERYDPILSVALCHSFANKPRFTYIAQQNGLFSSTTGFFGGFRETILHNSITSGPCFVVRWSPRDPSNSSNPGFVAWSTQSSVYIYNYLEKKIVFILERSSFSSANPKLDALSPVNRDLDDEENQESEGMQCFLEWEDAHKLLVGWDDGVQVLELDSNPLSPEKKEAVPNHAADGNVLRIKVIASFQLQDHWVLGVSPLEAYFVILGWPKASRLRHMAKVSDADRSNEFAEILLVNRVGVVVSTEVIRELKLSRDFGLGSFRLACSKGDENLYYAMNPDCVAAVRIQNVDVIIDRLLHEKKFKEAVEVGVLHKEALRSHRAIDLIENYINQLISEHDYEAAADVCVKFAKRDRDRWSRWLMKFIEVDQIQVIVQDIPVEKPKLKKRIYTEILLRLVKTDHDSLVTIIRKWPPAIYDVKPVIAAVEHELDTEFSAALTEVLTKLYLREGKVGVAMNTYTQLRQTLMESTKIADEVLRSKNSDQ
jgi:hypothetical protein